MHPCACSTGADTDAVLRYLVSLGHEPRTKMITGDLRNQIDRIWDAFWSGGISNPLEVIEQITYLLFLRRLDELQTLQELKAERLKKPIERQVFPPGKDSK